MDWVNFSDDVKLYKLDINGTNSDNVLFISIHGSLIRSKAAKAKANMKDWVFYSDPLPYYLSELKDWYIVLYDYNLNDNNLELIEDVISYIDKDLMVIIGPKGEIVDIYEEYTSLKVAPTSCIVGEEKSKLHNYRAYQIFPRQWEVILPSKQSIILTVGQSGSGRREVLENLDPNKYVSIERKGNWQKSINNAIKQGKTVIFQAGNESKEARKSVIDLAVGLPVYVFLFTVRGKDRENKYPPFVYERYSNGFEDPSLNEGISKIYRVN